MFNQVQDNNPNLWSSKAAKTLPIKWQYAMMQKWISISETKRRQQRILEWMTCDIARKGSLNLHGSPKESVGSFQ